MHFLLFIARRYLVSKKSTNVINLISGISVFGVTFCTAALIILLSAFNGLESWVIRLYNTFDPDLRIEHKSEKFFREDKFPISQITQIKGVAGIVPSIEENGLLKFEDAQYISTIKGVGDDFLRTSGVKDMMAGGKYRLHDGGSPSAIVGGGIAYFLSLKIGNPENKLDIFVPRPNANIPLDPSEAFHSESILPVGVFQIQPEFDDKYILVPIDFARKLFLREMSLSSLEVQLKAGADQDEVKNQIKQLAGSDFLVKDRFEQHAVLYKIINSEKWAVFLIGVFILLIAVFNITGSLTMLIVDKSNDIKTLQTLGAGWKQIRGIFFSEGLLISFVGLLIGIILGLSLVFIQDKYSLIMISDIDPYPVELQWRDLIMVSLTVIGISAAASWLPASKILEKYRLNIQA